MPDYKKLYTTLFDAVEQAANILITAEQKCEELYLKQSEIEQIEDEIPSKNNEDK